jgi:hypothetical protein
MLMVSLLVLLPTTAQAENMSGVWKLPSGHTAVILQKGGGEAIITVVVTSDATGLVRLVFRGGVESSPGGLMLSGTASSFPILWNGKRCTVENPVFMAVGELVGQVGGRLFHAKGSSAFGGDIVCDGASALGRTWGFSLAGTWR